MKAWIREWWPIVAFFSAAFALLAVAALTDGRKEECEKDGGTYECETYEGTATVVTGSGGVGVGPATMSKCTCKR